jgi:Secretion system C-terminal sorting domain
MITNTQYHYQKHSFWVEILQKTSKTPYYYLYLLLLSLLSTPITAQVTLRISQKAQFILADNTQITLKDAGLENSGNVQTFQSSITFSGNENAYIAGALPVTFDKLYIQKKTGKSVILKNNIEIKNKLSFQSGLVELQGNTINLNETGKLEGENEQNHVVEQMPLNYSCNGEGGKILSKVFVKANTPVNPGNIGVVIFSAETLGNLVLRRGHTEQNLINAQCNGMFRYFDFTGDAAQNKALTMRMYYLDSELEPDAEEKKLSLWQNNGKWSFQSIDTRNTQENFIEKKTMFPSVNVRWTVSPIAAIPTPTTDQALAQAKIFPNPTYDFLDVELADWSVQPVSAALSDMSGKTVWSQQLMADNGNLHLHFGAMPAGLYQLRLVTKHQTYMKIISFLGN